MAHRGQAGGVVAAYAWDMLGGGFPFEPIQAELRAVGVVHTPPSVDASRMDVLRDLWTGAGLEAVETNRYGAVTFADFDEFWVKTTMSGSMRSIIAAMAPDDAERFKERVRRRLPPPRTQGRITYGARANAIKGRTARRVKFSRCCFIWPASHPAFVPAQCPQRRTEERGWTSWRTSPGLMTGKGQRQYGLHDVSQLRRTRCRPRGPRSVMAATLP